LPPGIHEITWKEVSDVFGTTRHRAQLLKGLLEAAKALKSAGCKKLYLDGSFITDTNIPKDFDGCWESVGVDLNSLQRTEPALLVFDPGRLTQKLRFGGELFLAEFIADARGRTYLDFFQEDRDGNAKGILLLDLRRLDD
jgi:hypothetical protein